MLQCLPLNSSSTATSPTINLQNVPPLLPSLGGGTSTDGSPSLSSQQSPASVNVTLEYTLACQTNSYNEMWSRIDALNNDQDHLQEIQHIYEDEEDRRQELLTQLLYPNPDSVKQTLDSARDNHLTRLVSDYFKHSEHTTCLCLRLHQSVYRARALYDPLIKLLDVLPFDRADNFTQSQCDYAYDVFCQFDRLDNPFPHPDSRNFSDMRSCFKQLSSQLECRKRKSESRVSLVRRATIGSALCVVGAVAAIAVSAVAIAGHVFVAFVACPFCTTLAYHPRNITKKERAHAKQLDDSARFALVLNEYLITVERLVSRLHDGVEGNKNSMKFALERGRDRYIVFMALKELHRDYLSFIDSLNDLEVHIILCFNAVNKARSLLHDEIHLFQSSRS